MTPNGDMLILAEEFTKQGTFAELRKDLDCIEDANVEVQAVIAVRQCPHHEYKNG